MSSSLFDKKIQEFVEWKDSNFHIHKDHTYYAKTTSKYFDTTKYVGSKQKPTKYYLLSEIVQLYKTRK